MRIGRSVTCSCLMLGMACVTAFGQADFQFGVAAVFDSDGSMTPASAGTGDSGDVMDPLRIMIDDRQISVEAFITLSVGYSVQGHEVAFPCELLSDVAGRPPITYTPASVAQPVRPDALLTGSGAQYLLDPGSCDGSIPCTDIFDCPVNTGCLPSGFCTSPPSRAASVVIPAVAGDDAFQEKQAGTYYLGEVLYHIPPGAAGDYSARPECLLPNSCQSVDSDLFTTSTSSEGVGATATDLIIRIPFGACCDGSICAEDVLESACPSPLAWNPGVACADADCPEEVRPVPAMTTSGSAVLVLLLVIGLATTTGRRRDCRG